MIIFLSNIRLFFGICILKAQLEKDLTSAKLFHIEVAHQSVGTKIRKDALCILPVDAA